MGVYTTEGKLLSWFDWRTTPRLFIGCLPAHLVEASSGVKSNYFWRRSHRQDWLGNGVFIVVVRFITFACTWVKGLSMCNGDSRKNPWIKRSNLLCFFLGLTAVDLGLTHNGIYWLIRARLYFFKLLLALYVGVCYVLSKTTKVTRVRYRLWLDHTGIHNCMEQDVWVNGIDSKPKALGSIRYVPQIWAFCLPYLLKLMPYYIGNS